MTPDFKRDSRNNIEVGIIILIYLTTIGGLVLGISEMVK